MRRMLFWLAPTVVVLALTVAFWGKLDAVLARVKHFLGGIGPFAAQADSAKTDDAKPPREVEPQTKAKAAAVQPGMKRADVERALGRPSFARTQVAPDGAITESAAWIVGGDSINVEFRGGVVSLVTCAPIQDLPQASPPADTATRPASPAPTRRTDRLEDRLRALQRPAQPVTLDEAMKGLLNPQPGQ